MADSEAEYSKVDATEFKGAIETKYMPAAAAREAFLEEIGKIKPKLSELADIEEQVMYIEPSDDPDATPYPKAVREYTDVEKETISRSLRARLAEDDSGYIFHPYLQASEQQAIAAVYKDYIEGRATLKTLNGERKKLIPYVVASMALVELGSEPFDIFQTDKVAELADEMPDLWQAWFENAQINFEKYSNELNEEDPTLSIKADKVKQGPNALWLLDYPGSLDPRHKSAERVSLINQRIAAMENLVAAGYFEHNSEQHFYYYTPFSTKTDTDNVIGERNFKIHLMPQAEDVPEVAKTLAEHMRHDSELSNAITTFKVWEYPIPDSEVGDHPTPEIILYPQSTERAIVTALTKVRALFAHQEGRGVMPRFNISVEGNMVFLAEGHGHEKLQSHSAGELSKEYDETMNHAFKQEDKALAQRLIEKSKPAS